MLNEREIAELCRRELAGQVAYVAETWGYRGNL